MGSSEIRATHFEPASLHAPLCFTTLQSQVFSNPVVGTFFVSNIELLIVSFGGWQRGHTKPGSAVGETETLNHFTRKKPTTCLLTNVPQNLLDFVYAARSRRTALRETRSNKWYFFRFKDSWPQHPSTLAQHQCVRGRLRHALLYLKSNCFCFVAALNLTNELEILIATRAIFKQVPAMIGHRTWGCQRTIFVTCARG